jgi:hypothetical protein
MRRRLLQLIAAVVMVAVPMVASVAPAHADNASTLLGLVNALRASHGAPALYADPTLTSVAQAWSTHMAATASLVHNSGLASEIVGGGWTEIGENIGEGGVLNAIFNAFENSPVHLSNMINPTFNLTGVGVAMGTGNTLWVTEDFEAKPGATPAPTTTTTAPKATRPPTTTATTVAPVKAPTSTTTTAPSTTTTTVAPAPVFVSPAASSDTTSTNVAANAPAPLPAIATPASLHRPATASPGHSSGDVALVAAMAVAILLMTGSGVAVVLVHRS